MIGEELLGYHNNSRMLRMRMTGDWESRGNQLAHV